MPSSCTASIKYRSYSRIDASALRSDLFSSDLLINPASNTSQLYEQHYNTLTSLIDKRAPLKTTNRSHQTNNPWFCNRLLYHKQRKRQLERLWRKEGSPLRRSALRQQINIFNRLVSSAKAQYFTNNIGQHKNNPTKKRGRSLTNY